MAGYNCCDIDLGIASDPAECFNPKPGIKDARISCAKQVTVTETACPDAKITDIVTVDDTAVVGPSFYEIEIISKQSGQVWEGTYDEVTGNQTLTETITLVTKVKNREAYCALQSYLGQVVTLLWQENGSERWYMSGRERDLFVTSISGGTGTDEITNITIVLSGADIQQFFVEVFDTDATTTQALVDSVTV